MEETFDRVTFTLSSTKKRKLSALLAARGTNYTDFFIEIVNDLIEDDKDLFDLFEKKKNRKAQNA